MGFLGITVSYIMRMNLSVTIVAMVDHCKNYYVQNLFFSFFFDTNRLVNKKGFF